MDPPNRRVSEYLYPGHAGTILLAPETVLSDSAATALAAWRGGSNKKNGGGVRSSKKKLSCAQDNNLTKYWGAPLSSPKESALVSAEVKEGDARRIDRLTGYEFSATPQRAPRGAAMRFDGGAGGSGGESTAEGGDDNAASRMLEAGRGEFQTCSAGAKKVKEAAEMVRYFLTEQNVQVL